MYTWTIGRRYLVGQSGKPTTRALIAILGVTLMVAQWIVMVSIQSGFIDTFRDHVLGASSHVTVSKYGVYFSEYRDLQRRIEEDPDVVASAPYMLLQMQISGNDKRSRPGVFVRGIDLDVTPYMTNLSEMIAEGSLESLVFAEDNATPDVQPAPDDEAFFDEPDTVVRAKVALGIVLARQIRAEVGDVVRLNSPLAGVSGIDAKDAAPQGPSVAAFEVGAIIDTGFLDYDSKLVVIDYRALQDWYGRGDVVTGIEVQVSDAFTASDVASRLQERLGVSRYLVMGWPELHQNLFATLKRQKLMFTMVATSGMIVSSFLVLSVLIMIVLEKRKDIGILMSLGSTRRDVRRIFMYQGLGIGLIGSALGLVLGWALCIAIRSMKIGLALEVYRIDHLPVGMHASDFVIGALAGVGLCFVATIYPAYRASSVDPLEAIRD